jgi:hypothetical protein
MKNIEHLQKLKKIEQMRVLEAFFDRFADEFFKWLNDEVQVEEWRPAHIYGDFYEVSDRGRVRSIDRWVDNPSVKGGKQKRKGKILKQSLSSKGYWQVALAKDGKKKMCNTHKLVAMAFVLNDSPEEKIEVNHKNGNHQDPRVENLEWVTPSGNRTHAIDMGFRNSKQAIDAM